MVQLLFPVSRFVIVVLYARRLFFSDKGKELYVEEVDETLTAFTPVFLQPSLRSGAATAVH